MKWTPFGTLISLDPLAYIVDIIPEIIALIFVTGAAPSMALPYFKVQDN